jgi:hypothetical protein
MKRETKANGSGEQGRLEKQSEQNRATEERRGEGDVRPELGVLGWAARAQRLFGAMTLHA